MVLEITTQFPELGLCRAFDASLISDYSEEKEQLVSFAYLRIKTVFTRPLHKEWTTFEDMNSHEMNECKVAVSSKARSIFFAVHLFRQCIYSMSVHLEYWLTSFLYRECGYNELKDNRDNGCISKTAFVNTLQKVSNGNGNYDRILNILMQKFGNFRRFPNAKQVGLL